MMLTETSLIILTCAAFIAGLVNAMAGAGGLLTLPLLLWAGVPPLAALGTNKFQSVFGTLSSSINYFRQGHIELSFIRTSLIYAFIGSALGSLAIQQLSLNFLQFLVPVLLIATALYYSFSTRIADQDSSPRLSKQAFDRLVITGLGFITGFFGPGSGLFFAAAFSGLLGYGVLKATAHSKPLVLVCNSTSLFIFVAAGYINWPAALLMSAAQMIGGRIGSNLAIKKGRSLIRPLVICCAVALAGASIYRSL